MIGLSSKTPTAAGKMIRPTSQVDRSNNCNKQKQTGAQITFSFKSNSQHIEKKSLIESGIYNKQTISTSKISNNLILKLPSRVQTHANSSTLFYKQQFFHKKSFWISEAAWGIFHATANFFFINLVNLQELSECHSLLT